MWQKSLPLVEPYRLSGGRLAFESLDSTFVRIDTDEGLAGWGEGCPWGHSYLPAFGEGWGLYSERLSDEMGLYRDDWERIGMLSADSLRAGRLVVDTGIHALGWSHTRAVRFLADHSPMSLHEIEEEIDRYIAMPGQALSYMLGRLEIESLRAEAETRLGHTFDIKAFHRTVLGSGSVPLGSLRRLVERWMVREPS